MKSSTLHYSSFYLLIDYVAAVKDLGLALLQPWINTGRSVETRLQPAESLNQSRSTTSPAFPYSAESIDAGSEIWLPQVWFSEFGNDGYPDEVY